MINESAPALPPKKITKVQRAVLRRLAEFPAEQWLSDKKLVDNKTIENLVAIDMVERDQVSLAYRLTAEGRDIAEKSGESKFVQRQRHTIDRVAKYWTGLFEIESMRPAFQLALTRILSRELRLTPDAPLPECICSTELMHNTFPHHCPAMVPRTISCVAHTPDDVLLETLHRIGVPCTGHEFEASAHAIIPSGAFVRMTIDGDVIRVQRDGDEGVLLDLVAVRASKKAAAEEPPEFEPKTFDCGAPMGEASIGPTEESKAFDEWVQR